MSGWQDGAVVDEATPPQQSPKMASAPPPAAVPPSMPYDDQFGIVRGPDGSIQALTKVFESPETGRAPESIKNFLEAFPEDVANNRPQIAAPPTAAEGASSPVTSQTGQAPAQPQPPGSWQDGQVVGDSPQMTHARADATARVEHSSTPWMRDISNGFLFGMADKADALSAKGETAVHNAVANMFGFPGSGYSPGDAYQAVMDASRGGEAQFNSQHPWIGGGLGLLGMSANPLAKFGGAYAAGAKAFVPAIGRAAVANGVLGSVWGAGAADTGHEAGGALQGGVLGVLTAPVAPIAGGVLSPVVKPLQTYLATNAPKIADALPSVLGNAFQKAFGVDTAPEGQAARDALSRVGINFDGLSPEDKAAIGAKILAGHSGGEAAMQQAGAGLPVPVPLSQGQMSGQPGAQLDENLALRGARGADPAIYARDFQTAQQAALRGNVAAIGGELGGGQPVTPGQAGATVSDALNSRYDLAKTAVDQAYDAARAAGPTSLPAYDAKSLAGQVRQSVGTYDPLNIPRVAREVDRLGVLGAGKTDPDIADLFAARTRLSNLRTSNDPVEAGAAGAAVKAFDQGINDNLTESLFHGDPNAVQAWKTAIGARRDFGQLFQGNDLIEKLTTRQPIGGQMQLTVDPHDASNYIFGRSDLGFVGRQNLYRDLSRLKTVLGSSSVGWQSLKAEAFARLAGAADGTVENGTTQFSGSRFQKAWQDMKSGDSMLTATLFTPEERATIDRFAGVASRVTSPVRGGDNPSNTSVGAQAINGAVGAMKRLPFMVLKAVPFVDHVADALQNWTRVNAVKAATVGAAPAMVRAPVAAQAGAAAVMPITTMTSDAVRAQN